MPYRFYDNNHYVKERRSDMAYLPTDGYDEQFWGEISKLTEEEEDWAKKHLCRDFEYLLERLGKEIPTEFFNSWKDERGINDGDEMRWPDFCYTFEGEPHARYLRLFDEEGFDIYHLVAFVGRFLKKFRPNEVFRCVYNEDVPPVYDTLLVTVDGWHTVSTGFIENLSSEELKKLVIKEGISGHER